MKIYFFGDSLTYGHGLPDCAIYDHKTKIYYPGVHPSKYAWPNLVSKNLKIDYANLSLPGMSNLHIHWKIRHTEFNTDDIVVVQWSFSNRCIILDNDQDYRDIHICQNSKLSNGFFRIHSSLDLARRSLLIVEHTELLLKSMGTKYIVLANNNLDVNGLNTQSKILDYEDNYVIDNAMDNMHPGIETNKRWAERVTTLLKQKFDI